MSCVFHVAILACLPFVVRYTARVPMSVAVLPDRTNPRIVWVRQAGRGGGGGGGGNRTPEPPRQIERPGTDPMTLPVSKPPTPAVPRQVRDDRDLLEPLNIPAQSMAAALASLPGAIDVPSGPPTLSQGPGKEGGAGSGIGPGDGPGRGPGFGPGERGGTGGGAYRVGNDVTPPIEIRRGTPQYTTDAMRARIQGPILVECVVQTNGICTNIHVIRSLEPSLGLDEEAIKATGQWRFRPGTRKGEPVPVLVTIELLFTIR